jgi:peroxiredoxin
LYSENPNVVSAYNKYKSKGFTVLGVSYDQDKSRWIGAIEKDGLTWTQVSDLKGWGNETARLFGITGIPSNLLLDKEGKIIAKNLRGQALDQKLEELLK